MGGTDTTQTAQTQSATQLPPWINSAAQQNYGYAQNVATQPLQQYQGQLVADLPAQYQQAFNLAAGGGSTGQPQYNAAQSAYLSNIGQQPQQITPQTLSGANLSSYMNPYTQSVINQTLPIMQQNLGLQEAGNAASSVGQGAFGGSRLGVQQGVTQAQGAMGMAQMAAQLNQANYQQAQQGAQYDITNNLNAQAANQQAQQNQEQIANQAAGGLMNLGNAAQAAQAANFGELLSAGNLEQQQAQNQINANVSQYQQALQYPYQQLGVLESALGMTPYGQSTTGAGTQTTQTSANPIGIAGSALGMLGSLFGQGGALGAGSSLLSLSDRKLKTDIAKVGRHHTGVPMYAYRYKGDPKHYPKVVGPMAEDVAKIAPHAVAPIPGSGGKMAVNMGALNAMRPRISAVPTAPWTPAGGGARPPALPAPTGGGPVPGALSPPGTAGSIGALGGSMRAPTLPRMRRSRAAAPMRGLLGG